MDLEKKFSNNNIRREIKGNFRNENSIVKKGLITEKELIVYSRNKIIKDVDFARNTIPYIRGYILFVGTIFFTGSFMWSRFNKNTNISFSRMMLLNLAYLEEEKD